MYEWTWKLEDEVAAFGMTVPPLGRMKLQHETNIPERSFAMKVTERILTHFHIVEVVVAKI
jgi:hypothetical protein